MITHLFLTVLFQIKEKKKKKLKTQVEINFNRYEE